MTTKQDAMQTIETCCSGAPAALQNTIRQFLQLYVHTLPSCARQCCWTFGNGDEQDFVHGDTMFSIIHDNNVPLEENQWYIAFRDDGQIYIKTHGQLRTFPGREARRAARYFLKQFRQ